MRKDIEKKSRAGTEAVMFLAFGLIAFSFRNMSVFSSLVSGLIILYITLKLYSDKKSKIYLFILIFSILVMLSVVPFLTKFFNVVFILTGIGCLITAVVRALQYFSSADSLGGEGE